MNNELIPYDKYKETDLLWIDKIPKQWTVVGNRTLWAERKTQNCIDEELLSVTITKGIIRQSDLLRNTSKRDSSNLDKSKYKLVLPNDIAYNKMRMWQGAVGVSKYKGIVSPAYIVLKPISKFNPRYYHYLLRTPDYIEESHRYSYGMCDDQLNLRYEDFKQMKIIKPPLDEQDNIVKYLDFQLSKINKFIKAKKKLIAALKEQKQAVINEAVTKGINPNVKMRPSGIEWIGDIPMHWEIKTLRKILKPVSIKNRADLPLLSVVREKGIILRSGMSDEENHNFIPDDLSGYKVVEIGQFAMNKMKAWQGSYGVSSYNGIVSPAYYIFNLYFDNKEYFHYAIRSKVYVNFFGQASDGIRIGQWDLSLNKMKDIPFLVPPENEQKDIVDYIPSAFERIENSIAKIQQEIDLITEYCTTLISDVVTGKVDVRHIEIGDIIEEDTEIDETEDEIMESEEDINTEESGE